MRFQRQAELLFSFFDGSLHFPTGFTSFDRLAAVIELFAFGQAKLHLGISTLGEINAQGDQRETLLLCLAKQLVDLRLMEKQSAHPRRIVIHDVAVAPDGKILEDSTDEKKKDEKKDKK